MFHPVARALGALIYLAALVWLIPIPSLAMPTPGVAESVDVTVGRSSGASSLSIPLSVPTGTGAFTPRLALAYSSRAGDGAFGPGWQLAGLSEIRWSARFGVPAAEHCTAAGECEVDERFELNGQLLLWNAAESRYHTLVESFQKIELETSTNAWTVTLPGGTTLRYGLDENTRIRAAEATPPAPVARWLLAEMEDAHGNVIRFTYDRSDPGHSYVDAVTYSYRLGAPVGELRSFELVLEPRPDPLHDFAGGVERQITQRVREIRVTSGGSPGAGCYAQKRECGASSGWRPVRLPLQ